MSPCVPRKPLRVVAAARIGRRNADHDPNHHVPGVADAGEQQRDLPGREQVEPRFRLPPKEQRGEQQQEVADEREPRVEQAVDDVEVETAMDEMLTPYYGRRNNAR